MAKPPSPRGVRQARGRGNVYLVPTAPEAIERGAPAHHTAGSLALERAMESVNGAAASRVVIIVEREANVMGALEQALRRDGDDAWLGQGNSAPLVTLIEANGVLSRESGDDGALAEYRRFTGEGSQIIFVTPATSLELGASGVTDGVVIRTPCVIADLVALVREALAEPS